MPLLHADYTKGVEGFSYTYYEDLTPEDTLKIIDTLKSGGKPKVRAWVDGGLLCGALWVWARRGPAARLLETEGSGQPALTWNGALTCLGRRQAQDGRQLGPG